MYRVHNSDHGPVSADPRARRWRRAHLVVRATGGGWLRERRLLRVAVAVPQPLVSAGLEALVRDASSLALVAVDRDGDVAVERDAADIVLAGGRDVAADRLGSGPRTLVVAEAFTDARMFDLLRAGAAGVLLHASAPDLLEPAVRSTVEHGCFVDPRLAPRLLAMAARGRRTGDQDELTVQQERVLMLVARDLTNRQIAVELGLSSHTVKAHLRAAMRKLGATDRRHAVELARSRDLPGWG
jgi:DNA-binding NarL/FixJ family response regulator